MDRRMLVAGAGALMAGLAGAGLWWRQRRLAPPPLSPADLAARLSVPLPAPHGPLSVFHLGHSLVGRDMPAMLAQLAPEGHRYHSQLGWGASLMQHWEPDQPVPGYEAENAHPAHRPAAEAVASGTYDAVVMTEMVEIRDAIRWHDSPRYLAHWAQASRKARPHVRLYFYETWHRLDDPQGWLDRIETDLAGSWLAILRGAMARDGVGDIHLIPAGTAMAALSRRIEDGQVPGLTRRQDLFATGADGAPDPIHLNDAGAFMVALVHHSALYHRPPADVTRPILRADGQPATLPDAPARAIMAEVAWQTVQGYALSGVAPPG